MNAGKPINLKGKRRGKQRETGKKGGLKMEEKSIEKKWKENEEII
jgi:hypothetical protein